MKGGRSVRKPEPVPAPVAKPNPAGCLGKRLSEDEKRAAQFERPVDFAVSRVSTGCRA